MEYILIFGANTDIGISIAEKYASNGYGLYLADTNIEMLNNTTQQLKNKYENVDIKTFKFDVLEFYNHRNFYNNLNPKPSGVICAGDYVGNQTRTQKDFLEAKKIIDTNYTGLISIINIIVNDFEARNTGFIIGLGSIVGDENKKQLYTYYSSKVGILNYLAGLKKRLSSTDIKVIIVKPGLVNTEMTQTLLTDNKNVIAPEKAAKIVFRAHQKGKDINYKKGFGKFKMILKDAIKK